MIIFLHFFYSVILLAIDIPENSNFAFFLVYDQWHHSLSLTSRQLPSFCNLTKLLSVVKKKSNICHFPCSG